MGKSWGGRGVSPRDGNWLHEKTLVEPVNVKVARSSHGGAGGGGGVHRGSEPFDAASANRVVAADRRMVSRVRPSAGRKPSGFAAITDAIFVQGSLRIGGFQDAIGGNNSVLIFQKMSTGFLSRNPFESEARGRKAIERRPFAAMNGARQEACWFEGGLAGGRRLLCVVRFRSPGWPGLPFAFT